MTKPTHQTPLRATHGGRRFRIEFGGEGIGYLQDTLDFARECALELFGVPTESWTDDNETA